MPWAMIATVAAPLIGSALGSNSADQARQSQEAGAAKSDATQRYIFDQTRADNAPMLKNGQNASNRLALLSGVGDAGVGTPEYGSLNRKFSQGDLANDAVYQNGLQFGLDQGQKGIERQAAATGSMLSGATLKALSRFGNDYATQKAGDAYNRYVQEQNTQGNRLAGIAGSGQVASGQVGQAGMNYGNNVSQTAQNLGNARGASSIAESNAWSSGINNAVNGYQNGQYIDYLKNRPTAQPGAQPGTYYPPSIGSPGSNWGAYEQATI